MQLDEDRWVISCSFNLPQLKLIQIDTKCFMYYHREGRYSVNRPLHGGAHITQQGQVVRQPSVAVSDSVPPPSQSSPHVASLASSCG